MDSRHFPHIMAILNVTPNSMACGGRHFVSDSALTFVQSIIDCGGIDVVDIGGESTRPDGEEVPEEEEWDRLARILPQACDKLRAANIKISIDTRHSAVAARAAELGIDFINDVSGLADAGMMSVLKQHPDIKYIFCHSLTVPVIAANNLPSEISIVPTLIRWAINKIDDLKEKGINEDRIIFDPGIGFNKNAEHCMKIMKSVTTFRDALDIPICIGHSKKRFLGNKAPKDKGFETLTMSLMSHALQADYLRIHDAIEHKAAFDVIRRYDEV